MPARIMPPTPPYAWIVLPLTRLLRPDPPGLHDRGALAALRRRHLAEPLVQPHVVCSRRAPIGTADAPSGRLRPPVWTIAQIGLPLRRHSPMTTGRVSNANASHLDRCNGAVKVLKEL
jgi:hypothetical protein